MIFLVSRDWLESQERREEYEFAREVDKAVFAVLIEKLESDPRLLGLQEPDGLLSLVSGVDDRSFRVAPAGGREARSVSFSGEGLEQLKARLNRLGIDPRLFEWPPRGEPERAPYRGLEPFEPVVDGAPLVIRFPTRSASSALVDRLKGVLVEHPGDQEVHLRVGAQTVRLPGSFNVDSSNGLVSELRVLLGPDSVAG